MGETNQVNMLHLCFSIEFEKKIFTIIIFKLFKSLILISKLNFFSFSGRLISRSNVYNSLYFTSLRVLKVLKGSVPKRLHRHMRLLFHTSYPSGTIISFR